MSTSPLIGAPLDRIDGPRKVTGSATYAYEYLVEGAVYAFPVQSVIARGRVLSIDPEATLVQPGVLAVLWHRNAPQLAAIPAPQLAVLQSDRVAYHGQFIALVVGESLEIAQHAATLLDIRYEEERHDVVLTSDHPSLYKPARINAGYETDSKAGDLEAALATAAFTIDHRYSTPPYHNNPLEPHATVAVWSEDGESVTLYDANQGAQRIQGDIATAFGLPAARVRVLAPYVGGAFGSKAFTHPHVLLTVLAARAVARPVKLALTRRQMFAVVGYRTPTIQRLRLGADPAGKLMAIGHDVIEQTSTLTEFAEQTAVASRMMYAAPNRATSHRLARLDLPFPTIMRAPGECPGMFALESAIDELAIACGLDPIELRIRNEPAVDPETGHPFSSRGLVACLREGARRFGWEQRDWRPRSRQEGRWLIGTGVAASTYPSRQRQAAAQIWVTSAGQFTVRICAADIGTGAWTVLTQIAADALGVPLERVTLEIGDSDLPRAPIAGGSMGTSSWGTAIVETARRLCQVLREEHGGQIPAEGLTVSAEVGDNPHAGQYAMHAFGAQFAEARVNVDTGEVRVPRLLGVFAVGRVINAKTATSQLLGGMTMGLSMALHEESVLDPRFGDYLTHDLASYHIATNADVGAVEVAWIAEDDRLINPMGAKGIGEIGIVGTAAAIANAVYQASGIRVRDLPITLDKLL